MKARRVKTLMYACGAFSTTLALLLFNLVGGFLFDDEIYYMVTGQGYVKFIMAPNLETFTQHVFKHLWSPLQEAAGNINHPFFAKLAIGLSLLISGTAVPTEFHLYWKLTRTQLFWARLPSTLMASLCVFVICYVVYSRYGVASATLAGLFLVSDATFLQYSRAAMLDVYATTLMIASFVILISSPSLTPKRLCASALLAGLMLASKFALGVFVSFLFILGIAFQRRGWKGLVVCLAISLGLFFLVDFYYFLLPAPYLLNAFLAAGRPVPEGIGISQGPLAPLLAMFSWGTWYSISHTWSLVEVALVVLSLAFAGLLRIKRKHDGTGIDILFLANATLGFASFSWERPLVLIAPLSALFVATTIAKFSREYVPNRAIPLIQVGAIAALIAQLVQILPEAYSNSQFMYHASCFVMLPCMTFGGEIVLVSMAIFASALAISLLRGAKHGSQVPWRSRRII